MRTIETTTDKAVCFDEVVWLQERQIITFTHKSGALEKNVVRLHYGSLGTNDAIATYSLDANNSATIDVTDLIRANSNTPKTIYLWCGHSIHSAIPLTITYRIGGLINPKNVLIPETDNGWPMTVPTMYRQAFAGAAYRTGVEICASEYAVAYGRRGTAEVEFQLEPWEPLIVSGLENMQSIVTATKDRHNTYQFKELNPCARYAAVRWVSFTGKTRLHTLEVRDLSQTADEVIKLETLDGSYNQIKGRTDGFKLYLDDLTAYDYWYYSDIITSSKVEVSLDGANWNQVEVTTKSVTIPNTSEGKTNKLEITVNWRKYDAVTM